MKRGDVICVDEVGRGPLAGPICFGFVKLTFDSYQKLKKDKKLPKKGFDSKKLNENQRLLFSNYLKKLKKEGFLNFCIISFSAKEIDRFGLSKVIKKSIERGIKKIEAKKEDTILFDGGLKTDILNFPKQKTIIKGDEKEKIISWASILAKVYRDDFMKKQAKKYQNYGFESNVGYGSLKHLKAIKKYGLTKIHRKSFVD
jgi:ribonuclease HII